MLFLVALLGCCPSADELGLPLKSEALTLFEYEPVESSYGKYLGVPVMNGHSISLGHLGCRKALHTSSMIVICMFSFTNGMKYFMR